MRVLVEVKAGLNGGQTKEHAQLVRALGIQHLIVAVNKMDQRGWAQSAFEEVKAEVDAMLRGGDVGYRPQRIRWTANKA